jgi:hypothetical protein
MKPRVHANLSVGFTPFREEDEENFGVKDERLSMKLRDLFRARRAAEPERVFVLCARDGCPNEQREWWYFCSRECRDAYVKENG